MSSNPFDWLNDINIGKKDLIRSSEMPRETAKQYPAFMVNRGLSYFVDAALYANEMNQRAFLPAQMQYDYLMTTVSRKKRFSKWAKPLKDDRLEVIQEYYGYSRKKAESVLKIFSDAQIEQMAAILSKGGK